MSSQIAEGLSEMRAVLRDHIGAVCRQYVKRFDVFSWLEQNPSVAEQIQATTSQAEVIKIIRPHLEPYLEKVSGLAFCETCGRIHADGSCPFPELEQAVIEAAFKWAKPDLDISNQKVADGRLRHAVAALTDAREAAPRHSAE